MKLSTQSSVSFESLTSTDCECADCSHYKHLLHLKQTDSRVLERVHTNCNNGNIILYSSHLVTASLCLILVIPFTDGHKLSLVTDQNCCCTSYFHPSIPPALFPYYFLFNFIYSVFFILCDKPIDICPDSLN